MFELNNSNKKTYAEMYKEVDWANYLMVDALGTKGERRDQPDGSAHIVEVITDPGIRNISEEHPIYGIIHNCVNECVKAVEEYVEAVGTQPDVSLPPAPEPAPVSEPVPVHAGKRTGRHPVQRKQSW